MGTSPLARRGCGADAGAAVGSGRGGAAGASEAGSPEQALPSRRSVALVAPAWWAFWAPLLGRAAAPAATPRDEVAEAAAALKGVQGRWQEFEAATGDAALAAAGEVLFAVLGSTIERSLEITIPEGAPIGVDIEGRSVDKVNTPGMGWKSGDTIEQVNGAAVEDQADIVSSVRKAKEKGGPIKIVFTRRTKSPFVTLATSLRLIYENTNAAIPEVEEVTNRIGNLKTKASLLIDGIGELPDIRKRLDRVVVDLEAFAAAPAVSAAPKKEAAPAAAEGDGSGYSALFGQ